MNLFEMILFPFRWVVSAVLWVFHEMLTAIGMDPAAGITWVLCIVGLTLVMRTLTIPLFLKQIKSMRGMQELQPEMAKLQAKYKGKKDQLSRQAMAQEQMELYKSHGSNPFSACLPILVQMPIFFGLFQVLNGVPGSAAAGEGVHVIRMPEHYGMLSPILNVVPLQLLAYHAAVARGTNVDKPRNLAKSVTVE